MECCDTEKMKEMKEKMMSGNMPEGMSKCMDYFKEIVETNKAILEELKKLTKVSDEKRR